jgi:predicted secreted protein
MARAPRHERRPARSALLPAPARVDSVVAMIRLAISAVALSLIACNGCGERNAPPPNASGPAAAPSGAGSASQGSGDAVVHVEDDGKTFDVATGATVTFKLASNGGTGYVWMPTGVDSSVAAQQGERASESLSDVPGAPKVDVYRFAALRAGSTPIEMDLQRPWTKAAPPAKSIHVIVNVH